MSEENKNTVLPETPDGDTPSASVEVKTEKRSFLPEIHLTKRAGVTLKEAILVRVIAIAAALLVSALITVTLTGDNPSRSTRRSLRARSGRDAVGSRFTIWRSCSAFLLPLLPHSGCISGTSGLRVRF